MKSMLRIICRYSLIAGLIILIILASNGCILGGIMYFTAGSEGMERYSKLSLSIMEQAGEELRRKEHEYELSEKGVKILEESEFKWAMALDEKGTVVWQWKLPDEIPRQYSIQDVAVFSRWYLKDYPVKVLVREELLLVFGCDPEMISRYNAVLASTFVRNIPVYVRAVILINLLMIFVFILYFGYRFYGSMKPIAQGIEDLAAERPVHLKEKGVIGELAGKLNKASELLLAQREALVKRDFARTEWIAGVSHDIRTPLSLIMGYSDRLSKEESLGRSNRMFAENIRRQSLIIRELVADLNLTSKLAYGAQPLKKARCQLSSLIRGCVSDCYNEGLETEGKGNYDFEVVMDRDLEQTLVDGDEGLLVRALRNLLGNSIRHNPDGCRIRVSLTKKDGFLLCLVEDSGPGIPGEVVENMANPDSRVHIMGLRLAEQIARAHGGTLGFQKRAGGNYDVFLHLPAAQDILQSG